MTIEQKSAEKITDIVKVLNGGIEFYQDAAEKVDSPNIKNVFSRMITDKKLAATQLQRFAIQEKGDIEDGTNIGVDIRNMYTNVLSIFSNNTDHTYVSELEEVEDKVLEVFDEALKEDQPLDCKVTLQSVRRNMQECHDEMKTLQKMTA